MTSAISVRDDLFHARDISVTSPFFTPMGVSSAEFRECEVGALASLRGRALHTAIVALPVRRLKTNIQAQESLSHPEVSYSR
jgi:hypothetical protein